MNADPADVFGYRFDQSVEGSPVARECSPQIDEVPVRRNASGEEVPFPDLPPRGGEADVVLEDEPGRFLRFPGQPGPEVEMAEGAAHDGFAPPEGVAGKESGDVRGQGDLPAVDGRVPLHGGLESRMVVPEGVESVRAPVEIDDEGAVDPFGGLDRGGG